MDSEWQIYFPMTVNILTAGHIRCLEYLAERGFVTIGLLTDGALKGYKPVIMPFEDRKFIMETVACAYNNIRVVPQESLNPIKNLRRFAYTHLASGDGFEQVELDAIKKLGLKKIEIRLPHEHQKSYSASRVLDTLRRVII